MFSHSLSHQPQTKPTSRPKFIIALCTIAFALLCVSNVHAQAVVPGTTYRHVPRTVYQSEIVTKYRPEDKVIVEQKPVTSYKTETSTEIRERRYRVAKPVVETKHEVQRYTVRKPVSETSYREEFMDRTRYETETQWEEQRRVVRKPVEETSERIETRTIREPVKEISYKEETYTTYRPKTTTEYRWRDAGRYVDVPREVPGTPGPSRLQWLSRSPYTNPITGQPTQQRAGLYWVPTQGASQIVNQPQYVAGYVPEQRERTDWVPEQVTRRVPVERTRYVERVEYRKVPVKTIRMEEEEQYRHVPREVKKPVTERYTRKVPVTTTRWVEEERERTVPRKTYKTVYEERVEKVPVKVERQVAVEQILQRERTVRRYVPYKEEKLVPRTVVEKQLIPDDSYCLPYSASYRTSPSPIVSPSSMTEQTIRDSGWKVVAPSPSDSSSRRRVMKKVLPTDEEKTEPLPAEPLPAVKAPVAKEETEAAQDGPVNGEVEPLEDATRGSKPELDVSQLLDET